MSAPSITASSLEDAFPSSRKVFIEGARGVRVPMREIALSGGELALRVYDTSGPYTDPAAPIDIRVAEGAVEVLDRGPGVAPEDVPHLFDRFYRPVSSRSLPGSGLGLAIVKDVAEASGGHVSVRPREGGGSVFGITWPTIG